MGFLKWLMYTVVSLVYLIGLMGGAIWINDQFGGNVTAGMWFVAFYFLLTLLGWIYYKIRSSLPIEQRGFRDIITKVRTGIRSRINSAVQTSIKVFKGLLKISKWLIIIGIGIAIISLLFSWVAGLSATTIIIILLVMILMK